MKEQLARQLYAHGDLQHEPEYYGRGMSKPTHALIGTQSDFLDSVASLVNDLVGDALSADTDEAREQFQKEYEELGLDSLSSLRTDNLGNEIIYY